MQTKLITAIVGLLLAAPTRAQGPQMPAEWPQFRGPNSSGIAAGPAPPTEFGPGKNELWHLPLDPGHSSPCIAGDALYLTTVKEAEKKLGVLCIDRQEGTVRWERTITVDQFEKGHPSFNPASSSPCTDGERVVAYFGSYGLVCFDVTGKTLWEIRMPLARTFGGNAASPAIIGDRVILYRGTYTDHFVLAVDKKTGEELWRVPQGEPFTAELACTACPIAWGNQVVLHSARSVQGLDLATGARNWVTKCATTATSTPVISGEEVIVAAWNKMGEPALRPEFPTYEQLIQNHDKDGNGQIGRDEYPVIWIFHRPEGAEAPLNGGTIRFQHADRNRDGLIAENEWQDTIADIDKFRAGYQNHGILAVPLNRRGVIAIEQVRTLETQGIPEVPSPLCDGTYVYFVKNGGLLTCVELATGKRVYRKRTGGRGTHYASPVIGGNKIYAIAGNGMISVVATGPEPVILAVNDMQDSVYASPAIVDGTLYVRTHSALFAFHNQ